MVYWIGHLTGLQQNILQQHPIVYGRQKARHGSNLPYLGRRRLPFIGGIEVRLAHQLPGKPAAGVGGKHTGSN